MLHIYIYIYIYIYTYIYDISRLRVNVETGAVHIVQHTAVWRFTLTFTHISGQFRDIRHVAAPKFEN